MRILHIAQIIEGGIASFLDEIVLYQNEACGSRNVHFMVPQGSEHYLSKAEAGQVSTFSPTDRSLGSLIRFALSCRKIIDSFEPDIIHLHSTFAGAFVRAALLARRKSPPVIYCPHGWSFTMDVKPSTRRVYVGIERALAASTDLILANSESERLVAMEAGLPAEKLRAISNGIAWAPMPERTISDERIQIAFIGRNARQKGLDLLLDAIRDHPLPHVRFHVIGDQGGGPDATSGASGHDICYHGWCDRPKTLSLLQGMDAVIMPSRWDAAPIVALEAMRAGVAVIGSNRGGIPEIVGDGIGGHIFDLDDPAALLRLLEGLQRDELRKLGLGARKRWEQEHQADLMNQRTFQAYEDVLAARARAGGAAFGQAPALESAQRGGADAS